MVKRSTNKQIGKHMAKNRFEKLKTKSTAIDSEPIMLTPKQKLMLDFITQFREEHGFAASQHEIAKHFGFNSLGTVQNYLVRLERHGAIKKTWNARRGMNVSPRVSEERMAIEASSQSQYPRPEYLRLPLVGQVAAGRPIEAIQNEEYIEVPPSMAPGKGPYFILKIKGDSMIEDGILEGDFVIIKKQSTANNGQTVVALIDNHATIKRYYQKNNQIELHPANPAYDPLIISGEQRRKLQIEGVLAGVMRRL